MNASNRVIINTAVLYGRMLLTVGISLYSTRLILSALGTTDFGIFQLVGGVVAMLAFLNNALATSTQRFLSFHQGRKDIEKQKTIFTHSLFIHIVVGLGIIIVLASLEGVLFNGFLNIPEERIYAATIVYRMVLISLFFSMVKVPFMGSLIANENLIWVAVVNIIETLLKLGIAILLLESEEDRLILYGVLTASLSFIPLVLYAAYSFKNYAECTLKNFFKIDKTHVKELSSFAGWNLFGALCGLGRTQGQAILLNLFFGAVINTAYGIANQVSSQITFFSSTLLRAINPQIMKSEGADNRERMLRLSMVASKFGFFLVALFAIPIIFEMSEILNLWLKEVPEHTIIFTDLMLISILTNQLTIGLQSALQATGKIRMYQLSIGGLILMTLPLSYLFLKLGFEPYFVFVSYLLLEFIACAARIYISKILTNLSIRNYIERVFLKELLPVAISITTCYLITHYFVFDFRFLLTGFVSALVFISTIYVSGLCEDEKVLVLGFIETVKNKFKK